MIRAFLSGYLNHFSLNIFFLQNRYLPFNRNRPDFVTLFFQKFSLLLKKNRKSGFFYIFDLA